MAWSLSLLIIVLGFVVVASQPSGRDLRDAAALFPPWWPADRAFAAAGSAGEVARLGAFASILIVHSEAPDLVGRLKQAGALLVLDPLKLALCAPPSPRESRRDPDHI